MPRLRLSSLLAAGAALAASAGAAAGSVPLKPAAITFTTDTPVAIVPPGGAVRLHVQSPAQGKSVWRASDIDGATVAEGTLTASDGSLSFTPPLAFRGILYVTLEVRDASGATVASGNTRVAIMDTRGDRRPSSIPCLYAANAHLGNRPLSEAKREIAVMQAAGFGGCRFGCTWQHVQPTEGVWNWDAYDATFADLKAASIIPMPLIAYSVPWASTGDPNSKDWHDWNNAPPRIGPYTAFLTAAIARYKSYTHYWEIWNEPDIAFWLGSPEQYADLLDASVVAAHKADPGALVMNGGFSETRRRPDFIPTLLAHLTTPPDIYAYHSHGGLPNLERATALNKGYMADAHLTRLPMWDNESGYSNIHGGTEREQASQLIKKMTYAPSQGVAEYGLYDLRNDGDDPDENEHNFGIVRRDFAPKASFVAIHTFLNRIGGKAFRRTVPLGPLGRGYLFSDGKAALLVYWADLPVGGEQDVLIRLSPAGGAPTNVDMMGEESPLPVRDGQTGLSLRRDPQLLVLSRAAAERLAALPPALEAPEAISAAAGDPIRIRVTVRNPTAKPMTATLTARDIRTGVSDSAAAVPTIALRLAPGETVRRDVLPMAKFSPSAGHQIVRFTLQSPALPREINVDTEVRPALVAPLIDPAAETTARPPSVTLHVHPNGVALFLATPMRELQLRDDEDLSAKVWIGHTAHAIVLDVRARDDVHVQNEDRAFLWKGDSLQFALLAPGAKYYEWTFGLTGSGPATNVESAPGGVTEAAAGVTARIRREGSDTVYRITIPDSLPGISEALANGCKMDVLVNDNDGQGRKGWVEWTPGIGMTKDTIPFAPVVFR